MVSALDGKNGRGSMRMLEGKKILVTGLLSNRSIAYGVAKAMHREGAELAFTYQSENIRERVENLTPEFGSTRVFPCDVTSDEEIAALFKQLGQSWDGLDGIVHAIAYAPREALTGDFHEAVTFTKR
jgi:enoyl-[acyl-carrier protein] reductase I